jgi:multifunctional beta-oxidation protein
LAIKAPIPTTGTLISEAKILEVLDKGKQASVTCVVYTKDKATGKVIFENQSTVILRGSGGFGGKKQGSGKIANLDLGTIVHSLLDRGAASASNPPPKRAPDAVVEEKTMPTQAALYRLSGDYNPLHVSGCYVS